MTEEATQAAKETARQLLYLIEVVKMDADLQAEHIERLSLDPVADLTESVEDETIQHSDMLEDIRNELVDINRNLVQFFRDEQDRFQIQQDMADEQYFRTLEALREARQNRTPEGSTRLQSETEDGALNGFSPVLSLGGGAVAGAVAGSVAGASRFGKVLRAAAKKAAIIGAGLVLFDQVTDFVLAFDEEKQKLQAQGYDPDTVEQESARSALQVVTGNIYEGITESLVVPALGLIQDEMQWNDQELAEINQSIRDFKDNVVNLAGGLFDDLTRFFGEENELAFERETQRDREALTNRIAELEQETADGPSEESLRSQLNEVGSERLNFLMDKGLTVEEISRGRLGKLSFQDRQQLGGIEERQDELREQLEPFDELNTSREKLQELDKRVPFARAGYTAGELVTDAQIKYKELTAEQKDEFFKERIGPSLNSAIQSGAVERSFGSEALLEAIPGVMINAAPLEIKSLDKLMDLTKDQLEAIIINDDILNNSLLQTGAMSTGDRNIVESVYRMKFMGAADPRLTLPEAGPTASSASPTVMAGTSDGAVVPSPTISAAVPVNEMSSNMIAMSSTPIIISSTQGGSTVNNNVNNNSTTVMSGGIPARSSDVGHRRLQDRMQGVV